MTRYDAYLLRVWRGEPGDGDRWSCRLEHLPDGRHQRFGTLEELLSCLERMLKGDDGVAEPAGAPGTSGNALSTAWQGGDVPRTELHADNDTCSMITLP